MSYIVEPLVGQDVATFECGHGELDNWLQKHAVGAVGQGTRTYLLMARKVVVGYFAIAPHYLARDDAPKRLGRGAPDRIPAILLAKLALDRSRQGQGLGAELLLAALGVIVGAARAAGGRVVVVDAIDDGAAAFYRHHDFTPLPGDPRRLVLKISSAAKALGLPWP